MLSSLRSTCTLDSGSRCVYWYNKGVLQNKNRKYYFSSTKAESGEENPRGLHGSWQEENNQRGKGQEGSREGEENKQQRRKKCVK